MRDDFTDRTKRILAERVGNRCSNPLCRKMTSGPSSDPNKATNIGEAAHIAAASSGGKRYDSTMSSEERKSIDNGIWLCRTCARLIDTDEKKYTVSLLNEWKEAAESEARREVRSYNQYNIFDDDVKILKFISVCFYRPAFMDNIYCEGNMENLEKAFEDTAYALNTGILNDRNGVTIIKGSGVTAIRNTIWRARMEKIVKELYDILHILRRAKDNNAYEQSNSCNSNSWYIFYDRQLADDLNMRREKILKDFSYILRDAELPEIIFGNRQY